MQSPSSAPPQDQVKTGHTAENGESNIPPGAAQSGRNLQNKSQFRSIAPKIVPKVLPSRVLPCPSPSVSDQRNLAPSMVSKPLGVPTQNYALMQVAGQEGTFSLVALPNVASAQPVQKPRMSMPENLKLPIPRYQPLRSNKGSRKKWGLSSSESGYCKPPAPVQTCCQMSPHWPAHRELPHKPSPFKQIPSLDQVPASISTAPLTNSHGDLDPPATLALGTPEEPSAAQSFSKIPPKASSANKEVPTKPAVATQELKEQVGPAQATTSLSPAAFSSAVQLVSFAPMGKLPILPYSRMKTEVVKVESDADMADGSSSGGGADSEEKPSVTDLSAATQIASKISTPQGPKQSGYEGAFCTVTRLDLSHKAKRNSGTAKRKGKKRKVADEILAFQGKRRKCMLNMCRDGKERSKSSPQESRDQKPGAVRKYRSIMPKPVIVMSALAPLASPAATLQPQTSSSLGQGIVLNSLASKYLVSKQNDSPAPKPASSVYRNGLSGMKKPLYKCHVCNHHFQFKQHLLDHMNTHTNRRPYSCRICRKAYVRPGSLSTHMKLHHGENRPKKLVCCEFCAKVFGHIRVYFGHLKEVHRVVISTEPSPSELHPGDMPKNKNKEAGVQGPEAPLSRESKSSLEEDFLLNQADEVKLQIRCGRCQITAQSFAEIKFHLLHVHGEEIQGRLQEVILPGRRVATPDRKPHPGTRKQAKPRGSAEDSHVFPKLKKQLSLHLQSRVEALTEDEGHQPEIPGSQGPEGPSLHTGLLWSHSGFNCILCAQTLGRKEDLLLHWKHRHNCEDPSRLWAILSAFSNQAPLRLSSETNK